MNGARAYRRLTELGRPVVRTSEAAAVLSQSQFAASKTMARLAAANLVRPIRHGLFWVASRAIDPYLLPEYLTDPYASYVSLQTALYLHGMIDQIPEVIYVVSLGRASRIQTRVGTFSVHRITPALFGGFDVGPNAVKIASPEKALVDVAYLSSNKTGLFRALPELELPKGYRHGVARAWMSRIASARARARVERAYASLTRTATRAPRESLRA